MKSKNKRGRPPGSSRLNKSDHILLQKVADRMILTPTMKVTPVMVGVGIEDETIHRRLRRKWKPAADRYLREAHVRREEAIAEARREAFGRLSAMGQGVMLTLAKMQDGIFGSINKWALDNPEVVEGMRRTAERMKELESKVAPVLRR